MRKVALIGLGQTTVGELWGLSLREIAGNAIFSTMMDAGREAADSLFIGNMLSGSLSRQENIGSLISDWVGLRGAESVKVEAACGSGAAAFRAAVMAVASGEVNSAIAVGVEKMTETKGVETTSSLATAADADYEIVHGLSFVGINALVMQRYMYQYGWKHDHFAQFAINAHTNAIDNPHARLRFAISHQDYHTSRVIADPIRLLDASPIGDGAAAIYLVPLESIYPGKNSQIDVISVEASSSYTDTLAVHDRKDPTWLKAVENSAREAYRQAGLKADDIGLFELHDAFTIMAALSLEGCGFAERGQGPRLALDNHIQIHGKLPISTKGGLKARGHPIGATGIYQILEVAQQLRGLAGKEQVPRVEYGMAQNIGGSGATVITHILKTSHPI